MSLSLSYHPERRFDDITGRYAIWAWLAAINTFLYCSNIFLHYYETGQTSFKPLYWYAFTLAAMAAMMLLGRASVLKDLPRPLLIWLWAFLTYTSFNFIYSSHSEAATQAVIYNVESAFLFAAFFLLLIQPGAMRMAQWALLVVALLGVVLNIIDFFTPAWTTVPGRAAGLYGNPTISGKVLALAMVGAVPVVPARLRLLFCAVVGVGIILTFSRGAWILWALGVTGLSVTGYIKFKYKKITAAMVASLAGFLLYALLTGTLLGHLNSVGLDKFLTPDTLERLGGRGSSFGDDSATSRAAVALRAWEEFQDAPWIGHGSGYTMEWGYIEPHNMYLTMAANGGMLGVAVFLGLLFVVWRYSDPLGKVLCTLYAFSSLTSHNNLDQPAMIYMLALALALGRLAGGEDKRSLSSQQYIAAPHREGSGSGSSPGAPRERHGI